LRSTFIAVYNFYNFNKRLLFVDAVGKHGKKRSIAAAITQTFENETLKSPRSVEVISNVIFALNLNLATEFA